MAELGKKVISILHQKNNKRGHAYTDSKNGLPCNTGTLKKIYDRNDCQKKHAFIHHLKYENHPHAQPVLST